jgi:hypothetical protein
MQYFSNDEEIFKVIQDTNPQNGSFKDAVELKTFHTKFVNSHDTLISNLDVSGKTRGISAERRVECYNNFVGKRGRGKNLGLLYCFLVWEGYQTRFPTRRLDEAKRMSTGINETFDTPSCSRQISLTVLNCLLVSSSESLGVSMAKTIVLVKEKSDAMSVETLCTWLPDI